MSIHRTIFNQANRVLDSLSDLSRYYVWNSAMKHRAQGLGNLDSEQIKLVRDFFSPYKSISLAGHIFYTKKTGVFSQYYIPDSLWYAYIDPHFNP